MQSNWDPHFCSHPWNQHISSFWTILRMHVITFFQHSQPSIDIDILALNNKYFSLCFWNSFSLEQFKVWPYLVIAIYRQAPHFRHISCVGGFGYAPYLWLSPSWLFGHIILYFVRSKWMCFFMYINICLSVNRI